MRIQDGRKLKPKHPMAHLLLIESVGLRNDVKQLAARLGVIGLLWLLVRRLQAEELR